jgi:hypothetical protein
MATLPAEAVPISAHAKYWHSLRKTRTEAKVLNGEIRPFHSNFDCFRFGSHPVHPSIIENECNRDFANSHTSFGGFAHSGMSSSLCVSGTNV